MADLAPFLGFSTLAAHLSHEYFERPILSWRWKPTRISGVDLTEAAAVAR